MHDDSLFFLSVGKESTLCKPCLQLTLCQRGLVDFCNCTENVQIQASADSLWIAEVSLQLESYHLFTLWCRLAVDWKHTASRASLCRWWPAAVSLCAQCTQQMCWESEDGTKKITIQKMNLYIGDCLWTCWNEAGPYPQQSLLVLAVLHFGRRQVDDGSLHAVPLAAVQVDIGPAYHHVALHPAAGVGLQEVQVTLLRHNWAANRQNKQTNGTHKPLTLDRMSKSC